MKIAVSGAGGQLGRSVVNCLTERAGHDAVVAITRSPDAIASGVEVRFGDYDETSSLASAYAGIDKLLLIPSADLRPGVRARQIVGAVDAATRAGVEHIMFVSSLGASDAPEPDVRASYFAGEQAVMRSGKRWSVLRMAYYIEALIDEARQMLPTGMLTGLAETPVNFVSREDLARALAGLLTTDGHDGAIYAGTGPATFSGSARAAAVGAAAGKPMSFMVLSEEQMIGGMRQMGLPDDVVNIVVSIQQSFARGGFDLVSGDVGRLAGRPPIALEAALSQALGQTAA